MKRAYIYTRISKDTGSTLGLKDQEENCRRYAYENHYEVISCYSDIGVSGTLEPQLRPQFVKLLSILQKGDTILIAKRDRLGRDAMHLAALDRKLTDYQISCIDVQNPHLTLVDDNNPYQKAMRQMIDIMSELEVNLIRTRIKAALQQKKRSGYRMGHIPYGYTCDENGKILYEPSEQELLQVMMSYKKKRCTYQEIANRMNLYSTNRNGKPWNKMSVWRILKNSKKHKEVYQPILQHANVEQAL